MLRLRLYMLASASVLALALLAAPAASAKNDGSHGHGGGNGHGPGGNHEVSGTDTGSTDVGSTDDGSTDEGATDDSSDDATNTHNFANQALEHKKDSNAINASETAKGKANENSAVQNSLGKTTDDSQTDTPDDTPAPEDSGTGGTPEEDPTVTGVTDSPDGGTQTP
jgi:hypothetical protein